MKTPLYRVITDEILSSITQGKLRCGDRILSSREITERYGVSQITALRVFKELIASGRIVRRNGLGYYVKEDGAKQCGEQIFCAFRPPMPLNAIDNYGARIFHGIVGACASKRQRMIISRNIQSLQYFRLMLTDETVNAIAEEIASLSSLSGILLDMRFSDEQISRYILPVSGDCPVVIIGRSSELPVLTCSLPMKSCAREITNLAMASRAEHFLLFPLDVVSDSRIFASQLTKEFQRQKISADRICSISDALQGNQRDMEICEEIARRIKSAPKKLMLISSSDHWAMALLKNLREKDIEFGRDAALISLGGLEGIATLSPLITTIAFDAERMGELAVEAALAGNCTVRSHYYTEYKIDVNQTWYIHD